MITEALPDDKRVELLQQYQDMKTTFDEKCSLPNVTKNEKKHLKNVRMQYVANVRLLGCDSVQ